MPVHRIKSNQVLAAEIAEALFKNGFGEVAERLKLVQDSTGRDLGGWCRQAVADLIGRHLETAQHDR